MELNNYKERVFILGDEFYSKGSEKQVNPFRHSNAKYLRDESCKEGIELRKAIELQSKINWRLRIEKEPVSNKAKKEIQKMKREANLNFKNETFFRVIT